MDTMKYRSTSLFILCFWMIGCCHQQRRISNSQDSHQQKIMEDTITSHINNLADDRGSFKVINMRFSKERKAALVTIWRSFEESEIHQPDDQTFDIEVVEDEYGRLVGDAIIGSGLGWLSVEIPP